MQSILHKNLRNILPPKQLVNVLLISVVTLFFFELMRLIFLIYFQELATGIPNLVIFKSFFVGLRFDISIIALVVVIPFIFTIVLPFKIVEKISNYFMFSLFSLLLILLIIELAFFEEFKSRLNFLFFEYLGTPKIIFSMIWQEYPIFKYLFFICVLIGSYIFIYNFLYNKFKNVKYKSHFTNRIIYFFIGLFFLFWGARGSVGISTINWGTAYFSDYTFANQLALNGAYSLLRSTEYSMRDSKYEKVLVDKNIEKKIELIKERIKNDNENFIDKDYPLLRDRKFKKNGKKYNIVFIFMESFASEHIGILGDTLNVTPEFDKLAKEGILFENFYAVGSRTNRSISSTFCSLPNLPGKSIMKKAEGQQKFTSITSILKEHGYSSIFIYGGDLIFDNFNGYLRHIGFENFVDYKDFDASKFLTKWGADDAHVFRKANEKFREQKEPFVGSILTSSNHPPYTLPKEATIKKYDDDIEDAKKLNVFKYSDSELGKFIQRAKKEKYFANTIFVIQADHGRAYHSNYILNIEKYQIPLLLYAPQILKPAREKIVASQIDIAPTLFGILRLDHTNSFFGRDLNQTEKNDGFAIFGKNSRFGVVKNNYYFINSFNKKSMLYDLNSDNQMENISNENNIDKELNELLNLYLQTTYYLVQNRKINK
ncbi:MAG: LTA synthase family protein [Candidatus Marinimicrobia bacterium]|nr:LTA synthase family protein [Candidatus Neomarinimicrobiota bacterium]